MIHLPQFQHTALREYSGIIRKELLKRNLRKQLPEPVIVTGQELGFSNDEINEIIEDCYSDLTRIYN